MKDRWVKRRVLKLMLRAETGCGIQHTGWPCNTCFHSMWLPRVSEKRLHELWLATLRLRGDYSPDEVPMTDVELTKRVDQLIAALGRASRKVG